MSTPQIRRMGPETIPVLRDLMSRPPESWCWCVAWEVPTWEGWTERSADDNRLLRETLWESGHSHGYVLYLNGQPVGWARVGPRSAWPKLCLTREVEPRDDVYSFTCFVLSPEHRQQGWMHQFLAQMIIDLQAENVRVVEGFPKKFSKRSEPGEVWNGPLSLFLRAGFKIIRETHQYFHVSKMLDPSAN